ncbi:30S ribosomal protein S6 [Candidatus Woesearchaeota archaeon]|jgi:small subunit ribosomal protein S6|nr:30S ribosomal protein S6 [Candidatus Woesearchaeota archaeon]
MTTNIIQKEYEILYIIKPHLSEEVYKENCGKFEEMVNGEEGKIDYIEPQGVRDLATPIKKFNQGFYVESKFLATPKTLENIQAKFAVNEDILRHLIVTVDSIEPKETEEKTDGE